MIDLGELGQRLGLTWFDYQLETFEGWEGQANDKACLFYKTGAGKTITALTMLKQREIGEALVVTPPSTYEAWQRMGDQFNIEVDTISHAKFRMKNYQLSRHKPVIVDEFHMLGGHGGKGWGKLDRLARGLQAPLIICSATPSYNDAERVYCVAHVLDAHAHKGGFLEFLYRHCNTAQNPFGMTPLVDEKQPFKLHRDAADFMASLPGVYYLPDDLVYTIQDEPYSTPLPAEMASHGYNRRDHRIIASGMERRHTETFQQLVGEDDLIYPHVMRELDSLLACNNQEALIFSAHATVALALAASLRERGYRLGLVTGGMTTKAKAKEITLFKEGAFPILIGTASLATGTDGLDKMCNTLIILDDTDDDSLRRQLIGRIMPRGADTDTSSKRVYRLLSV